jgi:L-amino acid N-acyltransferase YncA
VAAALAAGAGFEIRLAGPEDAATVWRIYNQGIEDRLATFAATMSPLDEVRSWFGDPRYPILIAENRRQPAGFASLRPYRPGEVFSGIAEMVVYVERSWRRHAVGQLLANALMDEARSRGLRKLVGYLLEHNISSRKLVERLGFRVVGVHEKHGRPEDGAPNVVVVEKLL